MPAWAKAIVEALALGITRIVLAENDDEREEAAMKAVEDVKEGLDRKKFPNG